MLYDPARHEPLNAAPWEESHAREAIKAIVADTVSAMESDISWPWHPLDEEDRAARRHKGIYLGSAGVLWALWYLEREGAAPSGIDAGALMPRVYESYLAQPDSGRVVPSQFLGEAGVLLVFFRLAGTAEVADRLHAAIERNIENPVNEALWGSPGTMNGALHMLEWTGKPRWQELFLRNVDYLWRTWLPSPHARCHLWTQDLYGEVVQLLGAGHGFVGNVYPLLRGAALMPQAQREILYDRIAEALSATALHEADVLNWPPGIGKPRDGRDRNLVQWCHGAPGIVTATADYPVGRSGTMDAMLAAAGETTWHAGPLAKGFGICHGTAGNGYVFLKLHQRTNDTRGLQRARAFAMHAIGQSQRMAVKYGQRRHNLWNGDIGLAVYLWHCIQGSGGIPTLDIL